MYTLISVPSSQVVGGRDPFKISFGKVCQRLLLGGCLRLMDFSFVLVSFGTELAPFCNDPALCRLASVSRGLLWAPEVLRSRRATFLWHIFTAALLDLDRHEGYYNFEDWPVDNDLQPEQNFGLDDGYSSGNKSIDSEPRRLRPPFAAGM